MRNSFFLFAVPPEADLTPMQIAAMGSVRKQKAQERMGAIAQAIQPLDPDTFEFAKQEAARLAAEFPGVTFCVGETRHTIKV